MVIVIHQREKGVQVTSSVVSEWQFMVHPKPRADIFSLYPPTLNLT